LHYGKKHDLPFGIMDVAGLLPPEIKGGGLPVRCMWIVPSAVTAGGK